MSYQKYNNFKDFYQFYLTEHLDPLNRLLHFVGTSIGFCLLLYVVLTGHYIFILYGVLAGYFCAWLGHFVFEKNKPASFKQPLYSFIGDWCMWFQLLTGKLKFVEKKS